MGNCLLAANNDQSPGPVNYPVIHNRSNLILTVQVYRCGKKCKPEGSINFNFASNPSNPNSPPNNGVNTAYENIEFGNSPHMHCKGSSTSYTQLSNHNYENWQKVNSEVPLNYSVMDFKGQKPGEIKDQLLLRSDTTSYSKLDHVAMKALVLAKQEHHKIKRK